MVNSPASTANTRRVFSSGGNALGRAIRNLQGQIKLRPEPEFLKRDKTVFGNVKGNLGYRRFARRGLDAVNSEWRLICASHNILKLWRANPS